MSLNLLLDSLPEAVTVNGREYGFDMDFRRFIILEKLLDDPELDNRRRIDEMLDLFYFDGVPQDIQAAVKKIMEVYRCGETAETKSRRRKNGQVELKPKMVFSFEYDAPYIYSAFLHDYGIDLNETEYLHWWKFMALFRGLASSNKIVEIMGYRSADLGKIKNKDERSRIAALKRTYALPDNRTLDEKVAMAGAAFGGKMF